MRPEYYADEYRRYATYCRNYGDAGLYKIACGANSTDYSWTEVLMREAGRHMDGLSLHYYCGSGRTSRSATRYGAEDWFELLKKALLMEEIVARHSTIMDKYDPEKRVGLIVDEWGSWHEVEPGTNPGFLYQQNTMRDAMVAALTFNIFHSHADRVQMANIAQTINVLQAMILTEGAKMVLTPTYHVFEMFKVHQDSMLLPAHTSFGTYEMGNENIPQVSGSASRSAGGKINVSLCNLHHVADTVVECEIRGARFSGIRGRILATDSIGSHNTFEKPNSVKPEHFDGFKSSSKGTISVELPARSVVVLEIE